MRNATNNGCTLTYPEYVAFAFNAQPILVKNGASNYQHLRVSITGAGKTITHTVDFFDGKVQDDVRAYVQSFFLDINFDLSYMMNGETTDLGKTLSFDVDVLGNNNNALASFSFDVFYLWGGLQLGKSTTLNAYRKRKIFANFPFTFGLWVDQEATLLYAPNGRIKSDYVEVDREGLYEFSPNIPEGATSYSIFDYAGRITQATFDLSFDLTFYLKNGLQTKLFDFDVDWCTEGVYLRWVDHFGQYGYYLFKSGSETRKTSIENAFERRDLMQYDDVYGYHGRFGSRGNYEREDTIPLCAPLVDSDTFDFLQDLATSPVVDMYCGKDENGNPKWRGVQIAAGSFTKDFKKQLQDFVVNMVLPKYELQKL